MQYIEGGVTAAKGFQAGGAHLGIRKSRTKLDVALIYSQKKCAAAAVYTQNLVKGAPIAVTKAHIANGYAQAVICNSGNANTCNANGVEIAEGMSALAASALGIDETDVVVASTGVIGQKLDLAPFEKGMDALVATLSGDDHPAAQAIMTTDTKEKRVAVEFKLDGKTAHIGGIAKGSGMIHPNMATMLVFVTTDATISPAMLQKALGADVKTSFNRVSIDGDTSTNDMVCVLANGMAGNAEIASEGAQYDIFCKALGMVTQQLCRMIAKDGEGAAKLVTCTVEQASDEDTAVALAKSVICSSLVKAAMFGSDANWGRVLCALGYAGCAIDVDKVDVCFRSKAGTVPVCRSGAGIEFSEALAKTVLTEDEIEILVDMHAGDAQATAWGCDLTYDYVKINGDYRT